MAKRTTTPLTYQQERFVAEYVSCLCGTRAAIRAGYSPQTAQVQASQLLDKPAIKEAIDTATAKHLKRLEITAEKVLHELATIGFADMADYARFAENGELVLDWSHLPPGASKAVAEITQEEYLEGKGERAERIKRTKFKLHSKLTALQDMGKYLNLFKERVVIEGDPNKPLELRFEHLNEEQCLALRGILLTLGHAAPGNPVVPPQPPPLP